MNYISYGLTYPQKSILLTEQFHENTCVSNICGSLSIYSKINPTALENAINLFIKSNDSIRINLFGSGQTVKQFIKTYSFINIEKVNLSDDYTLLDLEKDVVSQHFKLLNSDLFRFVIFQNPDGTGGFLANLHHIISDAWSMGLLIDQIMSYYNSIINNLDINLSNNTFSYVDFINNEQKFLLSPKCEKMKNFWEEQFDEIDYSYISDNQSNSYDAGRESIVLPKELSDKLSSFCQKYNLSPFIVFMGILHIYLHKLNNTNCSTIGTPVLNRLNFNEKNTIGMFISTVPFKMEIDDNSTCLEFLNLISKKEFSIFRNQKYPYELLLDSIRKKKNISKNLYDISLSYQNARDNKNSSDISYSTKWLFNGCIVNNLDIHIYDMDNTGLLNISYDYKKAIFNKDDIVLLNDRLLSILNFMLEKPSSKISDIKILSKKEQDFIFNSYNNYFSNNTNFLSVYDRFKEQVKINPNKLAISFNDVSLSYKELNNLANNIACLLKNHSISHGDIVCLAFDVSIEFVASIIALQKLGACYIPIDINYPIDRIDYIIKNSNSKLVLTNTNNLNNIKDFKDFKDSIINISLDSFDYEHSKENIDCILNENDLAYIIYTSGSTGNPKGVKISHKSLSNYISWSIFKYVNNEETNFPLFSSVAFDLTVTSIFTPLCSGNCIYVYKNNNLQILFKNIIEDRKVQIIKLTPGHFSLLQDLDFNNSIITKFILGGDNLSKELCDKISSLFKHNIKIYNEYGPTEATVGCMFYEYDSKDKFSSVPIGHPIFNTNILLLDDNLNLVPLGYIGEIYISGDCLALGYTDELKTNEKFLDSPFEKNKKIYKTGDLAILHKDGKMIYIGRTDFQVKLNGYRIELGEIQSNLLTHSLIKDSYVSVVNIANRDFLCAYYVSDKEIPNLASYLSEKLPNYMIPNFFIRIDSIPLTINGKVDKKSLPLPKREKQKYISPKNPLEKTLQDAFSKVLNLKEKISVESNIFDYYIDSLLLIKLQSILYSSGININIQNFYEYKTIRKLSDFLLNKKEENLPFFLNSVPNIRNIQHLNTNISTIKNIILFGATGFLGIHILNELLISTDCNIYCIIRKKDHVSPIDRFKNKFNFYFPDIDLNEYKNRIKVLDGNILDENFGLDKKLFESIGNKADCVIDAAALVKHYGDYELFNKTNVTSTKRIIDFCKNYSLSLHYISTMSVSGLGLVYTPSADFSEDDLYVGQKFNDNVYVRSKFEAEKLIINSCKDNNFIANIYRVGTITNRFKDGEFQENFKDNAFLNRLKCFVDLKVFPNNLSDLNFDFTPVDYCADFIVKLLNVQKYNLNIYHLFNNNLISFITLINYLKDLGITIDCVDFSTFQKVLSKSDNNYFGITAYLKNIDESSILLLHNEKTNSILKSLGLSWPKVDKDYISKILKYLEKHSYKGGTSNEI